MNGAPSGVPVRRDERPVLLVLRALGLGDFLTGVPALRALAAAFPGHRRVVAVPTVLEPLVRAVSVDGPGSAPAVDDVLPLPGLQPLPPSVPPPDVAVNLHGRGPQSHRVLLGSHPGRLIAFAHPDVPDSAQGPEWRSHEHEVARWCRLLEESGIPARPDRLHVEPPRATLPALASGATVIHAGAKSRSRRWPPERWAAVARHERMVGRSVFLTGTEDEAPLASSVAAMAGLPSSAVLAGRTDVAQLAALVSAAGLVLSADTGVAHLATATGTPSVVLFGPVSPAEWGPPPERSIHRAIWAGRIGEPHADRPDPGLLAISVEQVLAAVAELRGQTSPAGADSVSQPA